MDFEQCDEVSSIEIAISDDIIQYIGTRKCDFRVSTSCGGPIILPTAIKPQKATDLAVPVGDYMLYISQYQASHLHRIHKGMIPVFFDHLR